MKKRNYETLFKTHLSPLSMRYLRFVDGGEGAGDEGGEGGTGEGAGNSGAGTGSLTLTQDELTKKMTKEKNEGRKALLRELGFTDENTPITSIKDAIKAAKEYQDSQKSELEKEKGRADAAEGKVTDAISRAEKAERKVALIDAGVNKEDRDDVYTLASALVDDKTDFEAAVAKVKEKHPAFFGESSSAGGTGKGAAGKRGSSTHESMGVRLAQQKVGKKSTTK